MKLIINGQETEPAPRAERLGPFLEQLQKENSSRGLYLHSLKIDHQECDWNARDLWDKNLADIGTLEVHFDSLQSMVERNLVNVQDYLSRLLPGIEKAAELFRTGGEQEANRYFLNIVEGMDWVSQTIDSITRAKNIDVETAPFEGKTLLEWKTQLLELTTQMLEANKNKDWVLLADLLEYEIHPYFKTWQTILPLFKS